MPFVFCNRKSLVLIKKNFRTYFIPVENAEEFVAEVNKRVKIVKGDIEGKTQGNTEDDALC